ncbi:uncharacterized protein V6R79_025788 [Siganus canaliculatus]
MEPIVQPVEAADAHRRSWRFVAKRGASSQFVGSTIMVLSTYAVATVTMNIGKNIQERSISCSIKSQLCPLLTLSSGKSPDLRMQDAGGGDSVGEDSGPRAADHSRAALRERQTRGGGAEEETERGGDRQRSSEHRGLELGPPGNSAHTCRRTVTLSRTEHLQPHGQIRSSAEMAVTSRPLLLLYAYFLSELVLIGCTRSEGVCLQDGKHKATPSPEPHLRECSLYADNSCCTEEDVRDISHVPSAANKNEPWDKCGPLSAECEGFLKRVSCFYRCSPDAARWPHPHRRSYIQAVPLCHSFCRDWFDACRMDMTCARNWARDPRGQNCTGTCVQYQQMYQHGRDLCESLWGDAFMTVEDEPEEVGAEGDGGRPCGCLTLSPSDKDVIAALRAQQDDPEELDTTKAGLPQYRAPCQTKLPLQAGSGRRGNSVLRKRSLVEDDGEGSGSGSRL